jgi:hypothetical protein
MVFVRRLVEALLIQFNVHVQAAGDFLPLVARDVSDCSLLRLVRLLVFIKRSLKWLILEKQAREFIKAPPPSLPFVC